MKKVRTRKTTVKVEVEGIIITGQSATPRELQKIDENNTNRKGKVNVHQGLEDTFVLRIVDWEGDLIDQDGKNLECTEQNKRFLWQHDQQFCSDILEKLNDALNAREDLAEKNS